MCTNGFEALKFQKVCRCHGNRKNTQFNTKVNNNHIFSEPKSEDFCIWQPFYTLATMAMATILNCFNPPKAATYYSGYSYKVDPRYKMATKYKNPPIWAKFGFQVDYDVVN
jgi:hypothetical protein